MAIEKVVIKAFEEKAPDNYGNPNWKVLLVDGRYAYLTGKSLADKIIEGNEIELDIEEKSGASGKYWKGKSPGSGNFPGKGGGRPYDPVPGYKSTAMDIALKAVIHNAGDKPIKSDDLFKFYDAILNKLKE